MADIEQRLQELQDEVSIACDQTEETPASITIPNPEFVAIIHEIGVLAYRLDLLRQETDDQAIHDEIAESKREIHAALFPNERRI